MRRLLFTPLALVGLLGAECQRPPTPVPATGGAPAGTGGNESTGGGLATGGLGAAGGTSATGGTTAAVVFPQCQTPDQFAAKSKTREFRKYTLGGHVTKPLGAKAFKSAPVVGASVMHRGGCAALDQGQTGSCTGDDATQVSSTPPYSRTCAQATQAAALQCYSSATKLDNGCAWDAASCPGSYPPVDNGSWASSAFRAAIYLGWFKGTRPVVQSLQGWHDALLLGPCGFDQNWYNAGFSPDRCGEVALTGGLAGGHSTEAVGFDVVNQRMWLRNSWGPNWGIEDGYFFYSFKDLDTLLARGATMVCPAVPQ